MAMPSQDNTADPVPPPPTESSSGAASFILLVGAFLVAVGAWTWFGTLDIVSSAIGEVVPGSKVRQVQHLEGGIVSRINAAEREVVKEGQILVELDSTQIDAEVAELRARLTALQIDIVRLETELAGKSDPPFPEDLRAKEPDQIEAAMALMETRRRRLTAEFNVQRQLIAQRRQEIAEVQARLDTAAQTKGFLDEQISISDTLLQQNITNRMQHIDLLKDLASLEGRVKEDRALIQRTRAALEEGRAKLSEIAERFTEEGRAELSQSKRESQELSERLTKFIDSQSRTVIRSPVAGTVKTLSVSTLGGVLKPGDVIAEIVPLDDRLVIDARLPLEDIGFVRPGLRAQITLTSADAARFGKLEGAVIGVSPDALLDEEGVPYYAVRIEPEQQLFRDGELEYRLYPGMRVASGIIIGDRRIAEYILDPYVSSMRAAFRER